jgi:hypothetical protein
VVFDSGDGQLKYDFLRPDRNPLDSWAHLALTPDQIRDELLEKQIPKGDADAILAMVFGDGIGSNRKMPGNIIAAFQKRLHTDAVRYVDSQEKNTHYRAAAQRYAEKELLTDTLLIYAQKAASTPASAGDRRPLVTVIVPLSRLAPMIRPALDSVATQTYTNLEVLLVNDVPAGPCLAVAEEFAGIDSRFHLRDDSPAATAATGALVYRYDTDATLECRTIETLVLSRYLQESPIDLSGPADLGPATLALNAVEELR